MWPPVPQRPIRMLRIGYMSAHWGVLPLAASGALARFDPDRTSIAVFTLGAQVRQIYPKQSYICP